MFIENLSSADTIYNEAGPSYDLDILSEYVKNNTEQFVQSNVSSMPNDVLMQDQENGVVLDEDQLLFIVDGQDNTFDDDVDELPVHDLALNVAQCISAYAQNKVVNESLTAELARYKEQVKIYKKRQEDTLELAKIPRKRMLEKMKSPLWVKNKIKISLLD
nr:retrovirus-related Pol polyprotein from transposon TNT 1-94 [Tanacetum cinerariifolium]